MRKKRYNIDMRWLLALVLFPTLVFAGEECRQVGGKCKEACAPAEAIEKGEFLDCTEKQQCCVAREEAQTSPVVLIDQYAFSPEVIKVKAGTEVVWKNRESTVHTVTAEDGSFDSGSLGEGAEFKKKFTKPGTYSYSCEMHSFMSGKVIVE